MRRPLAVLLLLLGGCSYYNGMYNVDHLAGRARNAEREGRTFEAASLWGQVSVRAESALVRHPHSGWADRAQLLQGTARARLRDCRGALAPLQVAMASPDLALAEEATMLVGTCQATLGNATEAATAFARLTTSRDSTRRSQALFHHGQALRLSGEYAPALAELEQSGSPRARGERAVALAGLGRVTEARALADSLAAERDTLAPWNPLLGTLALHDTAAARRLTDGIVADTTFPVGLRSSLLLSDARRLAATNPAAVAGRLTQIQALAPGPTIAAEAAYVGLTARLARMDSLPELAAEVEEADDPDGTAGPFAARLNLLIAQVRRVLLITDSTPAGSPGGDLRTFVAAELLRDSLLAPRLAARQFGRVASDWPDSPFAPKALLAQIALDTLASDSLSQQLAQRYGESPYVLLAQGGEAPMVAQLEDSLRRFAQSYRPDRPRTAPAPRPRAPARPAPTPQPAAPRAPVDQ